MVLVLELPTDEHRHTADNYASAATGDVVEIDGTGLVDTVNEKPLGILVEAPSGEFPQGTLLVLGNGALIDMEVNAVLTAAAAGVVVFSDGDGTMSSTKPTGVGGAGEIVWTVGVIEAVPGGGNSRRLRVDIQPIRTEA